jgi:hypothetical protein
MLLGVVPTDDSPGRTDLSMAEQLMKASPRFGQRAYDAAERRPSSWRNQSVIWFQLT